jgi:hypothetical protein
VIARQWPKLLVTFVRFGSASMSWRAHGTEKLTGASERMAPAWTATIHVNDDHRRRHAQSGWGSVNQVATGAETEGRYRRSLEAALLLDRNFQFAHTLFLVNERECHRVAWNQVR